MSAPLGPVAGPEPSGLQDEVSAGAFKLGGHGRDQVLVGLSW